MIALKLLAVVAMAFVAEASDLDAGLRIMSCAKRAITNGVPELDIPSHSPVYITRNFSWTGDIGVASASFDFHDFIWDGLPQWNLTATQLNKDSDPYAVFDFDLSWKWMNISGLFNVTIKELFLEQDFNGNIQFEWTNSHWKGRINVTKPYFNLTQAVNDAQIKWTVEHLDTKVEGLGIFNQPVEAVLGTGIITALDTGLIGNTVGEFIKMRLNTIWWSTGKIWELVHWCYDK
ncbi:unnamed protein product [Diabrotica balteata]|uniref:Uncharacterized protein n=1 Tax=Diabrotica balteata TaxID=107213 RepID=A0A9N9XB87_DIABA|nr:unnamed protein product [Diabrotica balteata]